jgi:hypothetical protein
MKFPYIKVPTTDPRKPWLSRSIIPVIISTQEKNVRVDALIDSGADCCLFNYELGKRLGLEVEKGQVRQLSGIEGIQTITWFHKIILQIVGSNDKVLIEAGFTKSPGVFAILGQEGFFDAFRIKFERDRGIIEISAI